MAVPAPKIEFKKPEFVRMSDVIWDIPQSFKRGMRVPARMIATKKLIDGMDMQVFPLLPLDFYLITKLKHGEHKRFVTYQRPLVGCKTNTWLSIKG